MHVQPMFVPVYSGMINTEAVCADLHLHGMVVIETMRTHAKQICMEVRLALGMDLEDEGEPCLVHVAFSAGDLGWPDVLIYTAVQDYVPDEAQEMVRVAINSWVEAGSPDVHYARMPRQVREL